MLPLDCEIPQWLGRSLLCEELLPWKSAKEINMSEFLKQYSIHDSYWITLSLNLDPYNAGTLVIRWDYQMGSLKHTISAKRQEGGENPDPFEVLRKIRPLNATLLIKFEHIENVAILPDDGTVFNYPYGMYFAGIYRGSVEEREGKQVLEILSNLGGIVTIVFIGKTFFLALDDDKKIIEL